MNLEKVQESFMAALKYGVYTETAKQNTETEQAGRNADHFNLCLGSLLFESPLRQQMSFDLLPEMWILYKTAPLALHFR
jgi:hypothetical protein